MLIRAGYHMSFAADQPTPMMALLSIHPSRRKNLRTSHRIVASRDVPMTDHIDGFGNVCTRMMLPEGDLTLSCDFVIKDSGAQDACAPDAPQLAVETLPHDVLPYLLGSRYCETDLLSETAWSLFGHVRPGWERVQAIVNYTHELIHFDYAFARSSKTALEVLEERKGVCRDFTHLAITLCRCMNIPARYCAGYLGNIRVPPEDLMDFSAWLDVFLGGRWYTFDPRHNQRRIGRILMAQGRDAADAALTTTFGLASLTSFGVHTYEVESNG